jgi:hypothetical protein
VVQKILNTRFEKVVHNGIIVRKNLVLTAWSRGSVYEARGRRMNFFTANIVKNGACKKRFAAG